MWVARRTKLCGMPDGLRLGATHVPVFITKKCFVKRFFYDSVGSARALWTTCVPPNQSACLFNNMRDAPGGRWNGDKREEQLRIEEAAAVGWRMDAWWCLEEGQVLREGAAKAEFVSGHDGSEMKILSGFEYNSIWIVLYSFLLICLRIPTTILNVRRMLLFDHSWNR